MHSQWAATTGAAAAALILPLALIAGGIHVALSALLLVLAHCTAQALLEVLGPGREAGTTVEQALPVLLEKMGEANARNRWGTAAGGAGGGNCAPMLTCAHMARQHFTQ